MNEIELLQKIKDAEQQLADARRMLEDYRNRIPFSPKNGETYWFISSEGNTLPEVWQDYDTDRGRYATDGIFRTKDDAKREVRRRKTHQKLKELAAKLNTKPIDFATDSQGKWFVYYHARDKVLYMGRLYAMYTPNQVYFTENCLDKILEEIPKEELINYCKGDY